MTRADAQRRFGLRLAPALPAWRHSKTGQAKDDGAYGDITITPDISNRTAHVTWHMEAFGIVRPVWLVVGPVAPGRGWPERLADATAGFIDGDPVEGVRHRYFDGSAGLACCSVCWDCPACGEEQWATLAEVVMVNVQGDPTPLRCASCGHVSALRIEAAAEPVRLRVVP